MQKGKNELKMREGNRKRKTTKNKYQRDERIGLSEREEKQVEATKERKSEEYQETEKEEEEERKREKREQKCCLKNW